MQHAMAQLVQHGDSDIESRNNFPPAPQLRKVSEIEQQFSI